MTSTDQNFFRWRIPLQVIASALPDLKAFPVSPMETPYEGPALFIRGELSDYLLPAHESLIRPLFPGYELETIAGAGHWLHAENPQAFYESVSGFLERLSSPQLL